MHPSLKLKRYLTGKHFKNLTMEVIYDKREVRVTILATDILLFASDEENTLEDHLKGYYNNQCRNV